MRQAEAVAFPPARRSVVARRTLPANVGPLKKAGGGGKQARSDSTRGKEGDASPVAVCRRSVDAYELLSKIGQGAYGVVYRAMDKETGEIVAIKKVDAKDATTLREISIMASLPHHPCIVGLKEVVTDVRGGMKECVFLVMEYAECNLESVIDEMDRPLSESEVKSLMQQLLLGIQCIHASGVLHRDLKPSNLLLNGDGELKVCDFGLSRRCWSGGARVQRPYSDWVVTLWYRAPELLFKAEGYSAAIDMWSAGCIMAELVGKAPLFPGKNELDQLHMIFGVLGTPEEECWPGFAMLCADLGLGFVKQPSDSTTYLREKLPSLSEEGFDLLVGLLTCDPRRRMTAEEALNHKWFM